MSLKDNINDNKKVILNNASKIANSPWDPAIVL